MKIKAPLLLIIYLLSFNSYAFVCKTTDGQNVSGGTQRINNVPLQNDIFEVPDRINIFAYVDDFMTCRNEAPSVYIDYLYLTDIIPGPALARNDIQSGAVVNGTAYTAPMTGGEVRIFRLASTATDSLNIQLYVKVDKKPAADIVVKKGDKLMTLKLHKYANRKPSTTPIDHAYFQWDFYSGTDIILGTGTCDINGNKDIIVDFETVNASGISTTGSESRFQKQVTLTYLCEDSSVNQNIKMVLSGDTSPFSDNALLVKTGSGIMQGLGVEIYKDGTRISPLSGSFLSNISNGIGHDTLTFSLVKKGNLADGDLIEGDFNSSATIIMVTP